MSWRRPAHLRSGRTQTLGIILLIFSQVHTPLPEPDFHNIRHQDGVGEVCEHHDHLLRWHPGAGLADDVAVLHWHWFLPTLDVDGPPVGSTGAAIHAHTTAWQAAGWETAPQVAPPTESRIDARPSPSPLVDLLAIPGPAFVGASTARGMPATLPYGATFAPRVSRNSLLQRWTC